MVKKFKVATLSLSVLLVMGTMTSVPVYAAGNTGESVQNHELEYEKEFKTTDTVTKAVPDKALSSVNQEIKLNEKKITINIGDTYDLNVEGTSVHPYWSSNDINKVSVNQEGLIKGVRKGSTIVTARVGIKTLQCNVTVVDSSIKLNKKDLTLFVGGTSKHTFQLKATVKGANKKDITWKSSNAGVVSVDQTGLLTANKGGVATITATANGKSATCKVIVKDTSIKLDLETLNLSTMGAGSSIKVTPTIVGSNKKIKWETSDKTIATVSSGKVTGKNTGNAVITATANGVSTTCNVVVTKGNVSISEERIVVYPGETKQLKSNATKKETPIWTSSDEGVLEVDKTGKIKALKAGTATIGVTLNDTYDTCEVIVKNSAIAVGQDKVELHTKGDDRTLQLGVAITGRTNKAKWTSSDKKVVTVDGKGKLTAKTAGTATITATANGVSDTVDIKVFDFIPTIKLNHSQYVLYTGKGNKVSLKATIVGNSKVVDWKSSDPSVATVKKGAVTALKAGEVVITATANGVSEDCIIKVLQSELILDKNDVYLAVGDTCEIPVDVIGLSKKASYKTSSSKIATVKNGVVTAKSNGDTAIKVTANGITEVVNIYVSDCKHEWKVTDEFYKLPTCKETGIKLESCDLCNRVKQIVVAKTECKFVDDSKVDITCTTNGTLIKKCEYCGETTQETLNTTGHSLGDWVVITNATDFTEGIEKRYCINCNYEEMRVVDAIIHKETEHIFDAFITNPTCVEQGYTTYICSCGYSFIGDYKETIEHSWDEWKTITEPTDTVDGTKTRECKTCGLKEEGLIPSAAHVHSHIDTVIPPTCGGDGYTLHKCLCGDEYKDAIVEKLGHTWGSWVITKEPTDTEKGSKIRACSVCEETETESILELKHEHVYTKQVVTPTCTTEGYTKYTCECGYTYNDSTVAKLEHNWNEGFYIVEPNCVVEGIKEYTCGSCGETKTETGTVDSTKHDLESPYIVTVSANCITEGELTQICLRCNTEIDKKKTQVSDHTYADWLIDVENTNDGRVVTNRHCEICPYKQGFDFSVVDIPEYTEKNTQYKLKFKIKENLDGTLSEIYLNNEWVDVTIEDSTSEYSDVSCLYTVKDTAGLEELMISKLEIGGGEYSVDIRQETEVLKSEFEVNNVYLDGRTLSFAIVDLDDAFESLRISVMDLEESETIYDEKVSKDIYSITLDNLSTNKDYRVTFDKVSRLGQDFNNTKVERSTKETVDIILEVDYNASVGNLQPNRSNDYYSATSYSKNEIASIKFWNSNINTDEIRYAVVNGVEVDIETSGRNSIFEFRVPDAAGDFTFTMTKIILADGREIELENPRTLTVTVLKDVPSVDAIAVTKLEDYNATLDFTLVDNDSALRDGNASVILIHNNFVIGEYQVVVGKNSIPVTLNPDEEYTAEIQASYVIGDGMIYTSQPIKALTFDSPYDTPSDVDIVDLEVTDSEGVESTVFNRGSEINVSFFVTDRLLKISKIVVGDTEYTNITQTGQNVKFKMVAPNEGSSFRIAVNAVYDSKGNRIVLCNDTIADVTIIKNMPEVISFTSVKRSDEKLELRVTTRDTDNALTSGMTIKVYDSSSNVVFTDTVALDTNTFNVPVTVGQDYRVEVTGSYDLANSPVTDGVIFVRNIHVNSDNLDLKDIQSITLYNNGIVVEELNMANGLPAEEELSNYYLEINTVYTPKLYTGVRQFKEVDNKVYAVADLDNFITYYKGDNGELQHTNDISVEVKTVGTGVGLTPISELIELINGGLSSTIELGRDYDASGLTTSDAALITSNFTGTLNGNGFTIYNLQAPLFNNLNGGTVKNINFKDANISGKRALIAVTMENNALVDGVEIDNCSVSTTENGVGLITGGCTSSTIRNIKITNSSVHGNNTIGAVAGQLSPGGVAEDCFVEAHLSGTQSHDLGTRLGGITGWLNADARIIRCYTDVTLSGQGSNGNGGLFGGPKNANGGTVQNCIGIASGTGQALAGFNLGLGHTKNSNVYQLSTAQNKNTHTCIKEVDAITKDLFVTTLGMKAEYWAILEKRNALISSDSPLKLIDGYSESNMLSYKNIMKIAPFLSSEAVISMGNKLTNENMKTKEILGVYAFNANKEYVSYINSETALSITTIKVAYVDSTHEIYEVSPLKVSDDLVAIYIIEGETIPYHFDKYIMNDNVGIVDYIKAEAEKLDYATNIATSVNYNNTIYADVYETQIKDNLADFAEKYVYSEYPYTVSNNSLTVNIKEQARTGLEKKLFAYTYLRKAFNFDIGGIDIADLLFFEPDKLDSELSNTVMVNGIASGNKDANRPYERYTALVTSKTNVELFKQLEFFIRMSGTDDYNQWLVDNWKGYVKSQEPTGYEPTPLLKWKAWDVLTNETGLNCQLLNLLSVPEDIQPQLGVITTGGQILFTDMNLYYNTPSEENIAKFRAKIDSIAKYYGAYVGSTLNYVVNGEQNLNNDMCIGYDTCLPNKWANPEYAGIAANVNHAPLIKYIMRPANKIYSANVGASCDGKYIWYGYMSALAYESFLTFTHENAHGMDTTYFLNGLGRRNSNAELFASGLFAEPTAGYGKNGDLTINRVNKYDITVDLAGALDYERVNTQLELQDYYKKLYDTSYALNTIVANAAIGIPATQKKIALTISVPNHENEVQPSIQNIQYTYSNTDWINAAVKDFTTLYDYKLSLRPLGTGGETYTEENFWQIAWYTPENPYGVPDAQTFKGMAHEFLGYYGWDKGLVGWVSNRYSNDIEAVQGITGYNSMRDYKLAKYNEAASKLDKIPYFDSERLEVLFDKTLTEFYTDIGKDFYGRTRKCYVWGTMWARKAVISAIKRVTDDFTDGDIYNAPSDIYYIDSAQELVDLVKGQLNANGVSTKGLYIKLTDDIDMSEVTTNTNYYVNHFIGILDGQGHKITGLSKPLFNKTLYTVVQNVEFDGTSRVVLAHDGGTTLVYDCVKDASKVIFGICSNSDKDLYPTTIISASQSKTGPWDSKELIVYSITEPELMN